MGLSWWDAATAAARRRIPAICRSPIQAAEACDGLSDTCWYLGQVDEGRQIIEEGERALADSAVPYGEIHFRLEAGRGFLEAHAGNNELAVHTIRAALAKTAVLPQTDSLLRAVSRAYNWLGTALSYPDCIDAYQEGLKIAERINDLGLQSTLLMNIADAYTDVAKYAQSMTYVDKGMRLAEQIGDLDALAYARATKGNVLIALGQSQAAEGELTRAIALSEQVGAVWGIGYTYADLALANLTLGKTAAACEFIEKALKYSKGTEDQDDLAHAHDVNGRVRAALQDWGASAESFEQALVCYQKTSDSGFLSAQVRCHYAEMSLVQGQRDRAVEQLREALVIFRALDRSDECVRVQKRLDDLGQMPA
jgi:tetratricopeptide (TPR) repeat protein